MEGVGVGVPEIEAGGSVPCQKVPGGGGGGAWGGGGGGGEERVFGEWEPFEFVFGSKRRAPWLRWIQTDPHRAVYFTLTPTPELNPHTHTPLSSFPVGCVLVVPGA